MKTSFFKTALRHQKTALKRGYALRNLEDGNVFNYDDQEDKIVSEVLQGFIERVLTEYENEYPEKHMSESLKWLTHTVTKNEDFARLVQESAKVGASLELSGRTDVGYMKKKEPVRVAVTGAAGAIAYSLIPRIASGEMLGYDQPVFLHLIDLPNMVDKVKGFTLEIEDCTYPLLKGIKVTSSLDSGFKDVDYALLVGSKPRGKGQERGDLLKDNGKIFVDVGKALEKNAKKSVLSLVVGNPANTNCLVLAENAKSIPKNQFSAMTRLDQNRALAQIAQKANVNINDIDNLNIWGNHSPTMYPDLTNAKINGKPALDTITDKKWVSGEFLPRVQKRGAEILNARGASSAASAADAALKHMRDWVLGSNGKPVSMAVHTDGNSYGVAKGLYSSFPVVCEGNGKYKILEGLNLDAGSKSKVTASVKELQDEKNAVKDLL